MKKILRVNMAVLLMLLLLNTTQGEAGDDKDLNCESIIVDVFKMDIYWKKEFKLGEKIILKAVISNISDEPVRFETRKIQSRDWRIFLTYENGENVPTTEYMKNLDKAGCLGGTGSTWEPGYHVEWSHEVNKFYHITKPGRYLAAVARRIGWVTGGPLYDERDSLYLRDILIVVVSDEKPPVTKQETSPAAAVGGQSDKEQELKGQIAKLKQNLRSIIAREAVNIAYSKLSSPHRSERTHALHFFGDIRAKAVLHCVLSTRAQTERIGFAKTDLRFLAEVFRTGEDALRVCEAILENAEGLYLDGSTTEGVMARRWFLTEMGKLLAQLAGVEFDAFKEFEQDDLRIWIVATLKKGWEDAESDDQKQMLQLSLKSFDPEGNYEIRKEKPQEREETVKSKEIMEPQPSGSNTLVIVLSIAVVVLAGVVITLLLRRGG